MPPCLIVYPCLFWHRCNTWFLLALAQPFVLWIFLSVWMRYWTVRIRLHLWSWWLTLRLTYQYLRLPPLRIIIMAQSRSDKGHHQYTTCAKISCLTRCRNIKVGVVKVFSYPTGRKFSFEFEFRYFANGKFAKIKFILL